MRLRGVRSSWEKYGRQDPLWAVLSGPERRGNQWELADFLATGRDDVRQLMTRLAELEANPPKGPALDFGCGVGRLTIALAAHFDEVHGVDIAEPMIERARELGQDIDGCTFHVNTEPNLALFDDATFAFVLTALVLQHNPRPAIANYVSEFGRVIRPGGVVVIQMPDAKNPNVRSVRDNLLPPRARALALRIREILTGKPGMQMNPVPRTAAHQMLSDAGLEVVAEDAFLSGGWRQVTYIAKRPLPPAA